MTRVAELAKQQNAIATVLTLFPHPRMVLEKDSNIKLLNTINERETLLKANGIENVTVKTFNKAFANLEAERFIKTILVDELNVETIIVGYDHRFGKNRSASIKDLRVFGNQFEFKVEEITAQDIKDVTVSSTKIRNALNDGAVEVANSFLGYNYNIVGKVVKGRGLGKTIQFPTANILIEDDYKLIPKDGVYVVKSYLNNKPISGMMNIGTNPTVGGASQSIEVHFFDLDIDLYGQNLTIEFLKRIRNEQKFESVEVLKAQLQNDKITAQNYINQ